MGLRERKKIQTRQAILETANQLFRERGYDETRITDIIEPVQISKKTFFNYFPSKDAVLAELAVQWFIRYTTKAGDIAVTDPDESPVKKLLANLDARLDVVIRDRDFVTMLVKHTDVFQLNPDSSTLPFNIVSTNYMEILDNIREAQQVGEFRTDIPASELNEIFAGVRNAIIIHWLLNTESRPGDLKPKIHNALKVLLKGFTPD